jgi:hypothetical protein
MIQSLVYPDLTSPNVNMILANLIYFGSFLVLESYRDEPTNEYNQDEMADEIVMRHRRLSNLTLPT